MALLACPECGKQVSPRAPACPGCGEPLTPSAAPATATTPTPEPELARASTDESTPVDGTPLPKPRDFVASRNMGLTPLQIAEREQGERLLERWKREAAPSRPPAPRTRPDMQVWLALAGGALLATGACLAWGSERAGLFVVSVRGIDDPKGIAVLVLGVLIALVGLARLTHTEQADAVRQLPAILALVAGGILVYVLAHALPRISEANRIAEARGSGPTMSIGIGIYLAGVGVFLALAAGNFRSGQEAKG